MFLLVWSLSGRGETAHALCDEGHEDRTEGRKVELNGGLWRDENNYRGGFALRFMAPTLAGAFTGTSGSACATKSFARLLRAQDLHGGLHLEVEQRAAPVGGADLSRGQAAGSAEIRAGERRAVKVGVTQDGAG